MLEILRVDRRALEGIVTIILKKFLLSCIDKLFFFFSILCQIYYSNHSICADPNLLVLM